jgi:hypothetical protein
VDVISDLDASMLAGYPLPVVRQLATIVAAATPVRYAQALKALAADPDITVRILLARRLRQAKVQAADTSADVGQPGGDDRDRKAAVRAIITEVLGVLAEDRRHTVRRAAAGLDS